MRAAFVFFVFVVSASVCSCGVPPPDRLEIIPPTPIKSDELGRVVELKTKAYRGIVAHDDKAAPLTVTWTTSDKTVADVSDAGKVSITGSGKAKITASVPGAGGKAVSADVDVDNLIVDSITATGDFPKVFKLDSKPVQLTVVAKNEKGQPLPSGPGGPKYKFSASDYCVEVTPEGMVHPLAIGECDAVVELAGKQARIHLDVK